MKLWRNKDEIEACEIDHVFIDNDYLGLMYEDVGLFGETIAMFPGKIFLDPFTRFEFLRDVFDPKIRSNKELFIENKVFNKMPDHPELYNRIKNLAIELSLIYASQTKARGVSLADLMLAAQLANTTSPATLLTGNRKDFPSIIFDLKSILNVEKTNQIDSVQPISLLCFNHENYTKYLKKLREMDERYKKEITDEISRADSTS